MNAELPTLHFSHKFSNGLTVTLDVHRRENEPPKMVSSHKAFQLGPIAKEYVDWVQSCSNAMIDDDVLTRGEIVATANALIEGRIKLPK